MAERRNRADLDRADRINRFEYTRDDRLPSTWRRDYDREDASSHARRVEVSERSGFVEQLVKLGLLGASVYAGARLFGGSVTGREIIHHIGQFGRNLSSIAKRTALHAAKAERARVGYVIRRPTPTSVASALSNLENAKPPKLGQIDLVDKLEESLAVIRQHKKQGGHVSILPSELQEPLLDRFKNPNRRMPVGHGALTIGDIVADKRFRGLVSTQQMGIIEQGVEAGLVTHRTQLGRGITKLADGSFRDVRWTNPWRMARGLVDTLVYGQIPLVGFPIGKFFETPLMLAEHMARKPEGIRTLRPGEIIGGVGRSGGAAKLRHGGWIVDGKLLAISGAGEVRQVAENIRSFSTRNRGLARVAGLQYGVYKEPIEMATGGLRKRISKAIGIGPEYKTERSVFSRVVMDPIRRIFRGELKLKKDIQEEELLTFGERVINELGGVKPTTVPKIHGDIKEISGFRGFIERMRALFGRGKYTEYVDEAAPMGKIRGIAEADPGVGFPRQGTVHYKGGWDTARMGLNWLFSRPSELMSWTFGVGYRPGAGKIGFGKSIARLFGAGLIAGTGIEAARYADYAMEETTGFSPIKFGADVWTRGRLFVKWTQDQLGITDTARYLEDLMPRSMSSAGSGLMRASLPLIGGVLKGPRGFAAGAVASVLTGGLPDFVFTPEHILKSHEDLQAEYSGTKRVPVRANRWWEFNTDEYTGGKIKYFKQSWYSELKSGYKYSDVLWGSKGNYWKYGSWLPTPSNWLGLRKLLNPDWLANQQAARRPYPTGSSYGPGEGLPGSGGISEGLRMGLGGLPGLGSVAHPTSMKQRFSGAFEGLTEQLGAFKFLGETVTGMETPFEAEMELAHASTMNSLHRDYWEAEMGSLLGATELIRRYLMPKSSKARGYNPLPNMMPEWLPGYRALFDADTRYFLDFHRGDPYTAVPKGEYRMPGPGYEAIHRLHSGIPGVYDAYDRYKILSDVAPYSQAFRHYRTIVKAWDNVGMLDESWRKDLAQTESEYEAVRSGYPHYSRRFTKADEGLAAINARAKYGIVERGIGAAWELLTHDVVPDIPFASKLLKVRSSYEHYLEDEIYGDEYRDWATPFESFIRPHMHKAWSRPPIEAAAIGGLLGPLIGSTPVSKLVIGAVAATAGATGSIITGGKGYVPAYRKEEWQLSEYMDKLAYVRAKRLQGISLMAGDQQAAKAYKEEAARTMVGLPANASIGQIQAALPANIKPYFRDMLTMPKDQRAEALGMLPQHVRPAFAQIWNMGLLSDRKPPSMEVVDFFSRNKLPKDDWLGWHPDVGMDLSRMKIVENHAQKLHHHGLWPQEKFENPVAYALMDAPTGVIGDPSTPAQRENLMKELMNVSAISGDLSEVNSAMVQNYIEMYHRDVSPFKRAWETTFGRAFNG